MPLPDGGIWPPMALQPVDEKFATWSAWYAGDPELLADVYERLAQRNVRHPNIRPTQLRGGLVGTLARWFWGQPTTVGEKRMKLHVPLAGDIASTSANLLFSEPPQVTAKDTATQDRLDDLLDDGMDATLLEAAEVCAALGGAYLKVCWDRDVSDRPWVTPMHADQAVPEWRYNKLAAVTFWRVLRSDATFVVRHLERHEMVNGQAVILHGVYQGTSTELGTRMPLADYPETHSIVDSLTEGDVITTGVPKLLAGYIPNMRPNRLWRNMPAAAWLGRSDYAGVEPVMDALDEAWSSWMRDLRLGKARLVVPENYLQSRGPGRGAMFDPDRELYEVLNMLPDGGAKDLTANQFAIRVDEHSRTVEALAAKAISGAGYALQTFGMSGDVAITATEVAAKERRSFLTRGQKIRYWRPVLAEMFETLLWVDRVVFGTPVTPERPDIEFGETVSADPQDTAKTLALLEQAKSISTWMKVKTLHPDWDDVEVQTEVDRIKDETGTAPLVDPATFDGGFGPDGTLPAAVEPGDQPSDQQAVAAAQGIAGSQAPDPLSVMQG
jgi:A118 family predicted phage portal protein